MWFVGLVSVLSWLALTEASMALAAPRIAKPGCQDRCRDMSVPYPFGIGRECALNPWFDVECNVNSLWLRGLRLKKKYIWPPLTTQIHIREQTLSMFTTILENTKLGASISTEGYEDEFYDLSGSPFLYSAKHNVLVLTGCGGSVVMVDRRNQTVAGCAAVCTNGTSDRRVQCYGIRCCQTTIPASIDYYYLRFLNSRDSTSTLAAFVNSSLITNNTIDTTTFFTGARDYDDVMTTVLDWMVVDLPIQSPGYANSSCGRDDRGSYVCHCKADFYQGNPYLPYGCQVVKECEGCVRDCVDLGDKKYSCLHRHNISKGVTVALGIGASIGFVLLLLAAYWAYQLLKRRRQIRLKAKHFKRNGGLLLRQQQSSEDASVEKIRVFTSEELEKATDSFNGDRILGEGGQGTVYKGMLSDGKLVAVKKSKIIDENQLNDFIIEVVVLSQISHRNVVKLLGCCLETEVPLLVYEFVPNGTLSQHIHDPNEDFPITWDMRLQIARETASALAYLHSSSVVPIFHRDIKSSNILLDSKYRAKLSDFGIARAVALDQTHVTTRVLGTLGYVDPEYFQSSQFTEKSDVYSFGVVLLELLCAQKAVRSAVHKERGLVSWFLSSVESSSFYDDVVDARVAREGREGDVVAVASLARRCLDLDGRRRPTMKEVAAELDAIGPGGQDPAQKPPSGGIGSMYVESAVSMTSTFGLQEDIEGSLRMDHLSLLQA